MKSTKPILIAAVIIAALILLGSYSSRADKPTYRIVTYTVQPGEGLSVLARRFAPNMDWREWAYEVCKLNGIDANLDMWQEIKVLEVTKQ